MAMGFASLVGALAVLWLALGVAAAGELRIVAFGDSLTAGLGLKARDAFPAVLERHLRAQGLAVRIKNAGVTGDTSAGGRARLDWAVEGPVDLVILELGANDGLRAIPPKVMKHNLDWILARLRHRGIPVLLAGMRAPPNLGRRYGKAYAQVFQDLALKHRVPLYEFFLAGVAARPEFNQPDGLHPNAKGVRQIVERIAPDVIKALGR